MGPLRGTRATAGLVWLAGPSLAVAVATMAGCHQEPHGVPQRVVIPVGASFRAAADSLAHADIVGWPRAFRLYASLRHRDRVVKPGTYLLQRGISWGEALDAVTGGKGLVRTVTIPEGWDLTEIVPLLARALATSPDSVAAAVRDSALLARVGAAGPTLEGYLFPDTYAFPDGTSPRVAVGEMVRQFERSWKPAWDTARQPLGMSRQQVVTLASIIEKETRVPAERPIIAAVYHNRLRRGMPLQADPTVQYALGHHVERVLYKDLDVASAYNTYRHPGLPPGPIASPGAASLEAAVEPANVTYLYFVAAPDGHHEFRTTFAEHTEVRRELQRKTVRRKSDHPS
jgi:peptidoglycan lytic transglycosylase G